MWEERFERSHGFWRGFLDDIVARFLDCGLLECGFARVFCDHCKDEYLLPFSCKCRGFCPSCNAKRAAAFVAFLKDELLQDVCHAQWVFSIPKMLRPYFLYHRELLGQLCQAAYEIIHWTPGSKTLFYESKSSHDDPLFSHPQGETLDVFEFIARVLTQIPEPRAHGARYFGAYSSKARTYRKKRSLTLQSFNANPSSPTEDELKLSPKKRAALRKSWAQLIKRVYQAEPLRCDCGGNVKRCIM